MATRIPKHYAPGDSPSDRRRRVQLRRTTYDATRANDPVRRFYNSVPWRRFAKEFLKRFPYCKDCGRVATQVDHIKTVRGHWSLRFKFDNLQSLCHACHSSKTASETHQQQKVQQ